MPATESTPAQAKARNRQLIAELHTVSNRVDTWHDKIARVRFEDRFGPEVKRTTEGQF